MKKSAWLLVVLIISSLKIFAQTAEVDFLGKWEVDSYLAVLLETAGPTVSGDDPTHEIFQFKKNGHVHISGAYYDDEAQWLLNQEESSLTITYSDGYGFVLYYAPVTNDELSIVMFFEAPYDDVDKGYFTGTMRRVKN